MSRGRCIEIATVGIDESLSGLSSDPFGGSAISATGLRVPAFVNSPSTRYLFLLAKRTLGVRQVTKIRGWRQLLTIGANVATGDSPPPSRPLELEVTTPTFRFPDGNVSWHLVLETPQKVDNRPRPIDSASFAYQTSDTPALLYQSATYAAGFADPITGSPPFYMLGMIGYVPPTGRVAVWNPLGELGNIRDLRAPWRDAHAWNSLNICIEGELNVCLYATVLQTNPETRPAGPETSAYLPPEEGFISVVPTAIYWRVGGALIFEDA